MKFKDYKESEKKYNLGGDWLSFEQGDNKIRVVSEFIDFGSHYVEESKRSIICIGKEECPECKKDKKPSVKYLGWAIDRRDGIIKVATIGHTIFKQIGDLAMTDDYAFDGIPDYDMNIKRSGVGLKTEYTVIADRKNKKLTEEEKLAVHELREPEEVLEGMKENQALSPDVEVKIEGGNKVKNEEVDEEKIEKEDLPF